MIAALDLTREEKTEERKKKVTLMECDAAEVVRHLAHELRQPLSTLESLAYYLDIILPAADIKARQQIEKIQQLVQQTNGIVDDAVHLLQVSPSHAAPVALDEIVTQIVADRGRGRRLNVHLELAAEPCVTWIDPVQAQHMLANIVNLFRQIAQPETPIYVATSPGPQVVVRLSCVAPGITEEELQRRFLPFNGSAPAGNGLALASARRIAEAHDGELRISADEDQRVTVVLRFPAV